MLVFTDTNAHVYEFCQRSPYKFWSLAIIFCKNTGFLFAVHNHFTGMFFKLKR